ncbi:disintegrin and metalloproteinase domain-containing protein 21-like [Oryctolagus cuniculus]|uniref:disintegrin and metalloproteinase domain-containing protein 21-like n=1 Tax=Oryctolagus cuniculus TaxID=9986 RepID=UPI0038796D2A
MVLAEGSVMLLLLGLWAHLEPGQSSPGRPSWRYVSSEVVIPRKELHQGKGVQLPGWLSYSLRFGGQRHVIRMRRKKLNWPGHLLMMTQDDQGALQMDYPYIPMDCYYLGHLQDIPLSTVTIDTCYGGLEGIMKLDDLAYEIKPLRDSHRFEHIVSQIVADYNATGPMYSLEHKEDMDPFFSEVNSTVAPRFSFMLYSAHMFHVKHHVQVTNGLFQVFTNVSKTVQFVMHLYHVVDNIFRTMYAEIYVSYLIIYDQADPVSPIDDYRVPGSPLHTLYYNVLYLALYPHSAIVLTPSRPHESEYELRGYWVCGRSAYNYLGYAGRHYFSLGVVIAHQQAKLLGVWIDDPWCICNRRATCVMYRYPQLTDSFSNCSFTHVQHIIGNIHSRCYFSTIYDYHNKTLLQERCGNRKIEGREKCDCGSFKQCHANKCCKANCELTPGSVCDREQCCTNCTYSPLGTLCRPVQNICDLPEYCRGSTFTCPDDFYLQDGTPCTEEGYCYQGNCTDRSIHCKEIFGEDAQNGHDSCYRINEIGFRFGHCSRGIVVRVHSGCSRANNKCGKLQCINVTRIPQLQEHVSFHQSLYDGVFCFGLDEHRGNEAIDVGHVRNGTPCADGLFCFNRECNTTLDKLNYDCSPEKCNFRGVCNNKKNCHCHVGWDPPACRNTGSGGSVDSGPPLKRVRTIRQSMAPVIYWRVVFARLYCLIFALLFGMASRVRTVMTTTVKEETIPEEQ